MKIFRLILLIVIILIMGCDKFYKDCICTQEFRMYSLTILDSEDAPIDSVKITVRDKLSNKIYDLSDYNYDFLPKGEYIIFHDGFKNDLSTITQLIVVKLEVDSLIEQTDFGFNTDECKCHVQKVFGPDTIWIDLNI